MHKIDIKPLSVNEAWQGRRYKTPKYNKYINDVTRMLPPLKINPGPLILRVTFGLSNKNADIDNPLKCFIDCLQKRYGFNDRYIYELSVVKVDVKKGNEFINFSLRNIPDEPVQVLVQDTYNLSA